MAEDLLGVMHYSDYSVMENSEKGN